MIRQRLTIAALTAFALALPTQALAAVKIHKIQFDSPGPDNGSNPSLNGEFIFLKNRGTNHVVIGGWTVRDTSGHVYRFPAEFHLMPGARVWVHTGNGRSGPRHRYWGQDNNVWNNTGDTARLRRANGTLADTCRYSGAGSSILC
jgi:hypothetical protein